MSVALSLKERHAITWLCQRGYRPVLGMHRNYPQIELANKDTGESEMFDINDVVGDYSQNRKEEQRARAAEKRIMANTQKSHNRGQQYAS